MKYIKYAAVIVFIGLGVLSNKIIGSVLAAGFAFVVISKLEKISDNSGGD
jgi:3-hydroxyisobutyrate dehydrogenase-like beta-hydroxyacid dehydrogenase